MKTKLVYVLTCAPEANYIEQALMSVWSARHWNPDAHIVLITDNLTDQLFVGKRAEILDYISEKIVVPFEDDSLSMVYRSRWLKTSVRQLIKGDFLFIDCDTIICKSLAEVDNSDFVIAMVPDEHMPVAQYIDSIKNEILSHSNILGYDVLQEDLYFNSGVMYAKDMKIAHELWGKWHEIWQEGEKKGIKIDQVALGKANLLCNHPIKKMDDVWNTLIYMNPIFAKQGKILHFWSFRNKSFMFCKSFLNYIRENGLTEYAKMCILQPLQSVLPFGNELAKYNFCQYIREEFRIYKERRRYGKYVDATFIDFPWNKHYSLFKQFIKIKILHRVNNNPIYYS